MLPALSVCFHAASIICVFPYYQHYMCVSMLLGHSLIKRWIGEEEEGEKWGFHVLQLLQVCVCVRELMHAD